MSTTPRCARAPLAALAVSPRRLTRSVPRAQHGKGKMTYPDSSSYDGGYKMDKRHGQGVYTYANGDTYAGGWANGVKHGKGCYFFQNKQCQFLGFWEASKFTAGTVRSWPRAEPLRRLPCARGVRLR